MEDMEEQLFTLPETNCTKLEDLIWVVGTTKFKLVFDQVFAFSDAKQAFLQVMLTVCSARDKKQ